MKKWILYCKLNLWGHFLVLVLTFYKFEDKEKRKNARCYTLRKFKWWRYCLYIDEIFYHFPLFDETFRYREPCTRVIRHIQQNPSNFSNSTASTLVMNTSTAQLPCTLHSQYTGYEWQYCSHTHALPVRSAYYTVRWLVCWVGGRAWRKVWSRLGPYFRYEKALTKPIWPAELGPGKLSKTPMLKYLMKIKE